MKLPHYGRVVVPQAKITDYPFSFAHRDGRSKAESFICFGFSSSAWKTFAAALIRHAADNEVAKIEDSRFGKRYIIEGVISAPDGRAPSIRSVWFIETGEDIPRFVTAYPLKGK